MHIIFCYELDSASFPDAPGHEAALSYVNKLGINMVENIKISFLESWAVPSRLASSRNSKLEIRN